MAHAVCIGEGLVVLRGRDRPEIEHAQVLDQAVGGAELNVALGLAALGVPTSWASRVGDDPFGRLLLRALRDGGVDVSGVGTDPLRPTGLYLKDRAGGRSRMHYRRAGSAATGMDADFLADASRATLLAGAGVVHVSGITPAVLDDAEGFVDALLIARRAHAFVLSVDLNWRPVLWEDRDPAPLHRLLAGADVVLAGADEAQVVWGSADPDVVRRHLDGSATLVLKSDAHEAVEVSPDGHRSVPALDVEVVEPIGAGDGFAAGYLAGLIAGLPSRARLRSGHLHAAGVLATTADHAPAAPHDVRRALLEASEETWAGTRVDATGVTLPVGSER